MSEYTQGMFAGASLMSILLLLLDKIVNSRRRK